MADPRNREEYELFEEVMQPVSDHDGSAAGKVRFSLPVTRPGPLFPEVRGPGTLHFRAPSAPGSETSREAAELVSVDGECLRCLRWFAREQEPRTRQELAMAVYPAKRPGDVPGLGPACGRVNDLVTLGYLAEVGRSGRRATLAVTEAGRRWLKRRGEAA